MGVSPQRLAELRAMPYREYLRTPEWQAKRRAALARTGHRCVLDRSHTANLEVHHNSYERLGDERPEDLVVLCGPCHARHHDQPPRGPAGARTGVPLPPDERVVVTSAPRSTVSSPRRPHDLLNPAPRDTANTVIAGVIAAIVLAGLVALFAFGSSFDDVDCADVTYAEAQRLLDEDPSDPHGLDRDGDGDACESNR